MIDPFEVFNPFRELMAFTLEEAVDLIHQSVYPRGRPEVGNEEIGVICGVFTLNAEPEVIMALLALTAILPLHREVLAYILTGERAFMPDFDAFSKAHAVVNLPTVADASASEAA